MKPSQIALARAGLRQGRASIPIACVSIGDRANRVHIACTAGIGVNLLELTPADAHQLGRALIRHAYAAEDRKLPARTHLW